MHEVSQALDEVRELYRKVLGTPAPEIDPGSYVAFPPGVDPLDHAMREFSYLKELTDSMSRMPGPIAWVPPADSYVSGDAYMIRVEIPGVQREDLKVVLDGGECIVSGKRKGPQAAAELHPLNVERPWGSFERRFMLPPGSHPDKLTAHCEDGILELTVTLQGAGAPKQTEVQVD